MTNLEAPKSPPVEDEQTKAATDAYAQSLLRSVTRDFNDRQAAADQTKHIFSKKRLIYLAISIVLSILIGLVASHLFKQKNSGSNNGQTQQLINGAENFNNPKAY